MVTLKIGSHVLGHDHPVFIVAEAGSNHDGNTETGHELIEMAARCGADGVKFQKFDTDRLVSQESPNAQYIKTTTRKDESLYQLLKTLQLSRESFKELGEHAKACGLEFWASVFDFESVDAMAELGSETTKVGSGDTDNYELIAHVARTGQVVQVSSGMSTMEQVRKCLDICREAGNEKLILYQCTSSYPCPTGHANLRVLETFRTEFPDVVLGFSDHTQSLLTPAIAVCLGAKIHERHITIDTSRHGADHSMSTGPDDYAEICKSIRGTEAILRQRNIQHTTDPDQIIDILDSALEGQRSARYPYPREHILEEVPLALGSAEKKQLPVEQDIINTMRKSIHTRRPIKRGERYSRDNLDILRPQSGGILPRDLESILGRTATRDIGTNVQLKPDMVSGYA
ncbi:MAG: N-acetylneuraminate synthase family protein [Pseudomonadales bacterium]